LCARAGVTPANGGYRFARGRGFRGGYGFQGGFGRGYYDHPAAPPAASQEHAEGELAMLKAEQQAIQHSLESVAQRIAELENDNSTP
jgi:hypothetical protein